MAITAADLFEAPAPPAPASAKPRPEAVRAEKPPTDRPHEASRPAQLLAAAWYDDECSKGSRVAFDQTSPWYRKAISERMDRCLRRLADCGYTVTHEKDRK